MIRNLLAIAILGLCPVSSLMALAMRAHAEIAEGALTGYIQTPRGGAPGSTSMERPSFHELNQHWDDFYAVGVTLAERSYFVEANYICLNPKAADTLDTGLITHAKTIPVETLFTMQAQFDWFTLGLGKIFALLNESWLIIPHLQGNWLHYAYTFTSPPAHSRRAFTLITAGVGLDIVKIFNDRWTGFYQMKCDLPFTNFHYVQADFGISYELLCYGDAHISPYLKVGLIQLDYEDEQTVPNHLRYTNFPWISLGFALEIPSRVFGY